TVVNVLGTADTTNLVGNGPTTVNVGNNGSVQGILGTLNVEDPTGHAILNIDDSADGQAARTVTLSTLGSNPADSESNSDPWGQVSGLAAPINYEYSDSASLMVATGTVAGSTINVQATGTTTTVVSHAPATVNVGSAANTLDSIQAPLTVTGLGGSTTLNYNDQGAIATGPATSTATPTPLARTGSAAVSYSGISTAYIRAGDPSGSSPGTRNFLAVDRTATSTIYQVYGGPGRNQFAVFDNDHTLDHILGEVWLHGRSGGSN